MTTLPARRDDLVASIRVRRRADGTTAYRVLFRHDGQQSTRTFEG